MQMLIHQMTIFWMLLADNDTASRVDNDDLSDDNSSLTAEKVKAYCGIVPPPRSAWPETG